MNKIKILIIFFLGFAFALPASAEYFDSYRFMFGEYATQNWVFFNGCTQDTCMDAIDREWKDDTYFMMGDYDVKQGVYQVAGPKTDYAGKGKLVFRYSYKFQTEESSDNTTDVGIIKIKDVDTEEVLYYKTLHAEDAKNKWTKVRKALPNDWVGRRLQLVFEVENDTERLSTLSINNVSFYHSSYPQINGTIYKKVAGKKFHADNVKVKLKSKKGTKTYKKTRTDENGTYTFFPVKKGKKYKIIAYYDGRERHKRSGKMGLGHRDTINLTFK